MDFIQIFNDKMLENEINWNVKGLLLDNGSTVVTLGSDSKLIGRIFELITYPILKEIAEENGYILEVSESQTVYPDYTYIHKKTKKKIAIDIKTTYRRYTASGKMSPIGFTLGAYASFIRDGKKNIAHPFNEYVGHYVVCFIYDRDVDSLEGEHMLIGDIDKIISPYSNVVVFAQEKHMIAGDKPGSGNTENIGTFKTNDIEVLRKGEGPFKYLGEEVYLDYWKNYPRHKEKNKHYKNLEEYFDWLDSRGSNSSEYRKRYSKWKSINQ